jgi:Mn2+/Fe2+ NRAMP family transporter
MVTGRGLAGVLREHYPRKVLYPAVLAMVVANTVNAGADLGAIAAAANMLVPIPAVVWVVPVTAAILAVQVFGSYRLIERVFKWLALALLAYVGAALFARPDGLAVLRGTLVPTIRLDPAFIAILVALLGTTISPYLFFWQASHEVEAELEMGRHRLWQRQGASRSELRYALWDTLAGMTFSEIVAYFIILATGATLFVHGRTTIASATDAAQALRPIAGDLSAALLAVGLIGAGVLAVPILTGAAAYGVSEVFGWPFGLDRTPSRAPQFYAVIVVATLVGMTIDFLGIDPIQALVATAVINGLLAPALLVLVMLVSNDRKVMGERTNGRWLNTLGWLTTGLMGLAAVALIVTTIAG